MVIASFCSSGLYCCENKLPARQRPFSAKRSSTEKAHLSKKQQVTGCGRIFDLFIGELVRLPENVAVLPDIGQVVERNIFAVVCGG